MSIAFICGVCEDARRIIIPYVRARASAVVADVRVRPLDASAVAEVSAAQPAGLVVAEAADDAAAEAVRTLLSRCRDHAFVVGVPAGDRRLLAGMCRMCSGGIYLLPVDADEIESALSHGLARLRRHLMGERIDRGTRVQQLEIELPTREVYAGEIAMTVADMLRRGGFAADGHEEARLAVAIEEALLNSVEHGNLELDSSLRPGELLEADRYEELKSERLRDRLYGDRKVFLSVVIDVQTARVTIRDEGEGFDYDALQEALQVKQQPGVRGAADVSGKGIRMIGRIFDSVRYEMGGRQIVLEKRKDR